jgi:hypothetical protein
MRRLLPAVLSRNGCRAGLEDIAAKAIRGGTVVTVSGFRVDLDGVSAICHAGSTLRRVGVTITEGERVTGRTGSDGGDRVEITQDRPALEARKARAPEMRGSLLSRPGRLALRPEDQRIDRSAHPDWETGAEGDARSGDGVFCTAGPATIHRVLGKTGNGSRLLELRLSGQPRSSFFAAASNVLLEPRGAATDEVLQSRGRASLVIG